MIDSRHVPLELRRYSDLSQLNNKAQNGIYCLNFLKKLFALYLQ